MTATISTPVLIVGAGPVGATLALELARHGVSSLVAERSATPSRHPKMDFVNARSMELFARLGVAGDIRARGVPPGHEFIFHWSRTFAEPPVATWRYPSVDAVRESIAEHNDGSRPAEPYQRLPGSILEDVLREHARAHPLIDLREGWRVTELEPDAPGAVVVGPDGERHEVSATYVVGCDGAGSSVRRRLGIGLSDSGPSADHCDIYFTSRDPVLRRHGRYFLSIVGTGVTLVSRDEDVTWTAALPVLGDERVRTDPVGALKERMGVDFAIDEVLDVTQWQGRLSVADEYRRGQVFLAGDAAHQFFPTGGHGANTGIGDAVDLGWKLAACLDGWGGPALLDSYEAERRPVALFNRQMCHNLLEVWQRFPALAAEGASRAHLTGFLAQDAYQIDNIGIHCGYRYESSPVVRHEDGEAPPWHWREIVPTTWPGGRAPSLRLADGTALYGRFGPGLTLVDLTGSRAGAPLVERAVARRIPMTHLAIDDDAVRRAWESDLVLVRPDQHVAWRGDATAARDEAAWDEVLDVIGGADRAPVPAAAPEPEPEAVEAPAPGLPAVLNHLTDRERAIARLVRRGLTNREIGSRVFLSPHTVNYHLRQMFRKLDVGSRTELAGLVPRDL
ncbi:FAD-dependent oxidoreductase [Myceligenerans halotolerans]